MTGADTCSGLPAAVGECSGSEPDGARHRAANMRLRVTNILVGAAGLFRPGRAENGARGGRDREAEHRDMTQRCTSCGAWIRPKDEGRCPACGHELTPADAFLRRPGWLSLPQMLYQNAYVWLVLVSALDVMLTLVVLIGLSGYEVNPIAAAVIRTKGYVWAIVFKFAIVVLVILICEAIGRRADRMGFE